MYKLPTYILYHVIKTFYIHISPDELIYLLCTAHKGAKYLCIIVTIMYRTFFIVKIYLKFEKGSLRLHILQSAF